MVKIISTQNLRDIYEKEQADELLDCVENELPFLEENEANFIQNKRAKKLNIFARARKAKEGKKK